MSEGKTLIILEGCDGVGKSTLASKLSDLIGYPVLHGSSFTIASKGTNYMFNFMKAMLSMEKIIVDRSFISNMVYGSIYDANLLTNKQIKELINLIKDKSLIVYLYASTKTIEVRLKNRGDEYVKLEDIEKIQKKYNDVINNLNKDLDILQFNVDTNTLSDIAWKIITEMQ